VGHREDVEGTQTGEAVATLGEPGEVAGQRGRVARHVGHSSRPHLAGDQVDHRAPGSRPGRVEDHEVGPPGAQPPQHVVHPAALDPHGGELGQVVPRVGHGDPVRLDQGDPAGGTHDLGQPGGEQPDPAVQVQSRVSRLRLQTVHDRGQQGGGRARVDLPEATAGHPEGAVTDHLGQDPVATAVREHQPVPRRDRRRHLHRADSRPGPAGDPGLVDERVGDPARVDRHDLVRAVPAQAG
jgi:hypothetical protein